MIEVLAALIPVFSIIALGFLLKHLEFLSDDAWRAVERLTYFVLFPAFLFGAIAFADFSNEPVGRLALLLAAAMIVMALTVYLLRPVLKLDGPAFTSLFQGSVRWNSYVALGAITAVLGSQGLALVAIAVAIMVPLANTLCVVVLVHHTSNRKISLIDLAKQLSANPLILACIAGTLVQLSGVELPKIASTTIELVGKAALPLGLLAVGTSLDLSDARMRPMPVIAASVLKLLVMPTLVVAGTLLLGVEGPAKTAALICAAVPGAPSSYILARQLGGDAPLMATITTAQTLAAMITMPVMLWVLG